MRGCSAGKPALGTFQLEPTTAVGRASKTGPRSSARRVFRVMSCHVRTFAISRDAAGGQQSALDPKRTPTESPLI